MTDASAGGYQRARPHWRRLVTAHQVSGKSAHDARLVALMQAHGVARRVTLNPGDFARYQEIGCLTPQQVLERLAAGERF
jgi:predicted nucleic acid-binding protein